MAPSHFFSLDLYTKNRIRILRRWSPAEASWPGLKLRSMEIESRFWAATPLDRTRIWPRRARLDPTRATQNCFGNRSRNYAMRAITRSSPSSIWKSARLNRWVRSEGLPASGRCRSGDRQRQPGALPAGYGVLQGRCHSLWSGKLVFRPDGQNRAYGFCRSLLVL